MIGSCRAFERDGARATDSDQARRSVWEAHLRSCPTCVEQDAADRALKALFARVARPELWSSFVLRCPNSVRPMKPDRPLGSRQRLILRAYWLAVLFSSIGILASPSGRVNLTPVAGTAAALAVTAVLLAVVVVGHTRQSPS